MDQAAPYTAQAAPHTVQSLASDLRALGVAAGDTVLMHSSARSLGFVAGGTQAVVQALLDVLGPAGTLAVPTHTPDNTDPGDWRNPPVPEAWWPAIRLQAPGFDRCRTPSRWMGVIAETVRTWPGALRSDHPQVSFAALGRQAAAVTGGHRLTDALGESSPLGAIYRLEGAAARLRARLEHVPAPGRVAAAVAAARGYRRFRPAGRRHQRVDHLDGRRRQDG
jgi:aminoglycoside 3-N-acetyltransferase